MIIIFSDRQDQHSNILYNILERYNVEVKLILPHDIKNFYYCNNKAYIYLENGLRISSSEHFFINRIPLLPYSHPLIMFIYFIPYTKILIHPEIASMVLSKVEQLKYFQNYPTSTIIKNQTYKPNKLECVKSMSQIRSTVSINNSNNFITNGLKYTPVQFQDIINGTNIKTHIIGNDFFSYKITSTTLDPRISESKTEYIKTSNKITKTLNILKEKIGINYFDCDLIINNKDIYILEINVSPAPIMFALEAESYIIFERLANFIINNEYKIILG